MIGSIENWWIIVTLFIGTMVELVTIALITSFGSAFIWNTIKYRHEDKEFRNEDRHFKENVKYSERRKPGDSEKSRMEETRTSSSAT